MYVRSLHFNLVLLFPFVAILELQLCNFCRKFVKFFLWQGNCYPSFIVLKNVYIASKNNLCLIISDITPFILLVFKPNHNQYFPRIVVTPSGLNLTSSNPSLGKTKEPEDTLWKRNWHLN